MRFFTVSLLVLAVSMGIGQTRKFPPYHGQDVVFHGGSFADTTFDDMAYVASNLMDSLFKGRSRWFPDAQQLRLRDAKKREWVFTLDNPFITVDGEVFNLTYPVRRTADAIYLPLHPLLRLLRAKFGINLPLANPAPKPFAVPNRAAAKPALPPLPKSIASARKDAVEPQNIGEIAGLDLEEKTNGTMLKVRVAGNFQWEGLNAPPHYLFKLSGASIAPTCPVKITGKGMIREARISQEEGVVQITLRLRENSDTVEVAPDSALPGFQITVRKAAPVPAIPKPPPVAKKSGGTIIIDAGHGGHDRGAIVRGVQEADVTLAVARQLRIALQNVGYRVRLTRETDDYKTLAERPKFASDQGGDVFVSLHCNSLAATSEEKKSISGYTVYILREGESEEDKALARRENQAIQEENGKSGKKEISPVDWMLLEHQLNLYSKQSESLAESIVKTFDGFDIPKYSTGARQAGFFVLVGAYMPAVLFEMGFLTNAEDRIILSSKSGQREIAQRMAQAIDAFRK